MVRLAGDSGLLKSCKAERESLLEMVRLNCKKMSYGGIFDHLGGGFARYSVDEKWLVPHFEKMLYDNALLASLYLDMHRATQDPFYSMIARKTLDYLMRDMLDPLGGIHSTEDADSEGVEGKYYVWSKTEIEDLLKEDAPLFCDLYNVTVTGNFEGKNILNMTESYDEFARRHDMTKSTLRELMSRSRAKLLEFREQRVRPAKDDKILVSWNALAISAFAKMATTDEKYLAPAIRAAEFIRKHMTNEHGRLFHTHRHGASKLNGFLDDYAYLINSLVELFEASQDPQWLVWANELTEQMVDRFADSQNGGFFYTPSDHEPLISRPRSFQDSSVPSGNAMAATALIRLGRLLNRSDWLDTARRTLEAGIPLMRRSPLASGQMLVASSLWLGQHWEFVLVTEDLSCPTLSLVKQKRPFNSSLIVVTESSQNEKDPQTEHPLDALLRDKRRLQNEPTLYVCQGFQCNVPIVGYEPISQHLAHPLTAN